VGNVSISALVIPTIASPIQNFITSNLQNLPHLQGLRLAHPVSSVEELDISLLIGVDHYWDIVGIDIVRGRGPTVMQSKFYQDHCRYNQTAPLHSYTAQTLDL